MMTEAGARPIFPEPIPEIVVEAEGASQLKHMAHQIRADSETRFPVNNG